ncbi:MULTISPECIES: UV DNA damage repair endonuclease UvsE [Bacillaceae]|uniref:UV DNA damage repair endonuclease UvsE n=1 Tax=Evansella alkalicola TaxID=745819 RepID=A0ABS6JU28_9BACI|nr:MULTISPECIES: UV DNA damage repair endonuclease UvsE [Bacillaceae]MBU9722046.1 UV DNA damage repair endonuclease UvsE [Bacillus alkalicola]
MTLIRLGYVAMSVELKNSSPSQTMTYNQFEKISDRNMAMKKLERIAESNLKNCLRLLKHNLAHDIYFFRFSSKLIPLATHEELIDWKYMRAIKSDLIALGEFIEKHQMRVDFHPDHFVILNSTKEDILKASLNNLKLFYYLLKGMGLNPEQRCVMHVGGGYKDKETALENFIENWSNIQRQIQQMIMLENDDKTFTLKDTLYICEKLGVPLVFDYHHHLANNDGEDWTSEWDRVVNTWNNTTFPIKMHISSPKSESQFRYHADYVDPQMFLKFLKEIDGSIPQIDCMIEAKQKDHALFRLMRDLEATGAIEKIDGASFTLK